MSPLEYSDIINAPATTQGILTRRPIPDASKETRKLRITLTMIVRNECLNLPTCLASVAGLFDEIIVVDTGSTDRTPEIARAFGAEVIAFEWVDDFAAARNAALERATGDYAFWLDADESLDEHNRIRLRDLLNALEPDSAIYAMKQSSPAPSLCKSELLIDQVRLFPNSKGVHWIGRIHEQILPFFWGRSELRLTDVVIHHTGYIDPQVLQNKLERDHRIVLAELQDQPDDPATNLKASRLLLESGNASAALTHAKTSLAGLLPESPNTCEVYGIIARAHHKLGNHNEGLLSCESGLAVDSDNADLLSVQGHIYSALLRWQEAEACWRRLLELRRPNKLLTLTTGIYGHETRRNLCVLLANQCRYVDAFKLWADVLSECPGDPEAIATRGWLARRLVIDAAKNVAKAVTRQRLVRVVLLPVFVSLATWQLACGHEPLKPSVGPTKSRLITRPDRVKFGVLKSGRPAEADLVLENLQDAPSEVRRVETSCPCLSISGFPVRITPQSTATLTVRFDPEHDPDFRGSLSVEIRGYDPTQAELFSLNADLTVDVACSSGVSEPADLDLSRGGENYNISKK